MKWIPISAFLTPLCLVAQSPSDDPAVAWKKANELDSLGQHERSIKILDGLIGRPGWTFDALSLRSSILFFDLERYEEAMDDMNTLVRLAPDSMCTYLNRSSMYLAVRMPDRALADLDLALERSRSGKDSLTVLVNLGAAYMSINRPEDALRELDRAVAIDPKEKGALTNRANALDDLGRSTEAREILLALHDRDPDDIPLLNNLGFLASRAEDHNEAIAWFEKARALAPDDPYVLNNLGFAKLQAGEADAALRLVQRAVKLAPGNSYAYRNLGLVLLEKKETDKACDAFEASLARGFTEQYGPEVDQLRRKHCH